MTWILQAQAEYQEIQNHGGLDFPLAAGSGLRKVRAMPKDVGFWIVMSGFLAALLVFAVGWVVARRSEGFSKGMDANSGTATGDPIEGFPSDRAVEGFEPPASPSEMRPPPLPEREVDGWWRVPSGIYHWYDLIAMGFLAGVYLLPLFLELFMGEQESPKLTMEMAVGTFVMQFMMVALVTGFVAWRLAPSRWLGLKWRFWPLVFPISIVGVLFTWGVLGVFQMLGFFDWLQGILGNDGQQEVVKAFTENDDPVMLGMLVILAVIVAPLTEEILFRGYLYPVSKRFIGRWAAIVFSALVFAVIHHNAQALIPLFVLSVLLTLAYEFTGSIWAPIGMHTLFNGATVGVQLAGKYGLIELPAP